MDTVQVLRKFKKIEDIENYLFAIRRNLDFHFFVNGATTAQPEYKLDALVWTCIFHEKVPRYSERVYKMSQYLLRHYQYLKTLDYTTIEKGLMTGQSTVSLSTHASSSQGSQRMCHSQLKNSKKKWSRLTKPRSTTTTIGILKSLPRKICKEPTLTCAQTLSFKIRIRP